MAKHLAPRKNPITKTFKTLRMEILTARMIAHNNRGNIGKAFILYHRLRNFK